VRCTDTTPYIHLHPAVMASVQRTGAIFSTGNADLFLR